MKVLVIDDERFILESISKILQKENFSVVTAENKKDAIEIIENQELDLIITDIMLPFSGGFDIVEHVKEHPVKSKIPVIVITGMDEDVLVSTKTFADACLTKPFTAKQLMYLVKKHLPGVVAEREE